MYLVYNNLPRVISLGNAHNLLPSLNEVPDAVWEGLRETPVVKALLKQNAGDGKKALAAEKAKNEESAILGLSQAKALQIISETVNPVLLSRWKSEDNRPPILSAIDKQLQKIASQAKQAEGEPGEGAS